MPPKRVPPQVPKKPNPSMNYSVLIYLNSFYFGMFACCELAMGLLKAINLSYVGHTLTQDMVVMGSFILLETIRLILGRKGSLADKDWQAAASVVLTLPTLAVLLYLCYSQTYVLKLEIILSALTVALHIAELVYASIFICTMCRPVTYT